MARNLPAMAKAVRTESDFLHFLRAHLKDWEDEEEQLKAHLGPLYGPGPNGWENGTIGAFLDAMLAWATDADQTQQYDAPPDWNLFASMLLAGKEYE